MGSQAALGAACEVTQAAIHKWSSGKSVPNPRIALKIEKATQGKVTRFELIPEFYEGIEHIGPW